MAKEKKNSKQEISISEIESLRTKAENRQLDNSDSAIVINLCDFSLHLLQLIDDKNITIARLRKSVFGSKSEKCKFEQTQSNQQNSSLSNQELNQPQIFETYQLKESTQDNKTQSIPLTETVVANFTGEKKKRKGHGRLSADKYVGAKTVYCLNTELRPKGDCPHDHCTGSLYDTNEPQVLIKRESRPIIDATFYKRQVLRCGRCGDRFTASLPKGVHEQKYDVTADVMITILHYSGCLPFYRLERLQEMMGVPLPASNQYERSEIVANAVHPIFLELERQAAKLDVLHTDDTSVKILSLIKENKLLLENERKGMHTTGINARSANFDIALYYSGRRYSGENLSELLKKRPNDLIEPIIMADAEEKNWPVDYVGIIAKCLVHARRQFVNCQPAFEEECGKVINDLGEVYNAEPKELN